MLLVYGTHLRCLSMLHTYAVGLCYTYVLYVCGTPLCCMCMLRIYAVCPHYSPMLYVYDTHLCYMSKLLTYAACLCYASILYVFVTDRSIGIQHLRAYAVSIFCAPMLYVASHRCYVLLPTYAVCLCHAPMLYKLRTHAVCLCQAPTLCEYATHLCCTSCLSVMTYERNVCGTKTHSTHGHTAHMDTGKGAWMC